ncbi:MAG: hypothetical protein JRC87_00245 [Deltaproteobacteria bacterium]|nr:hypothetical protein [Deltaproteobacteria bacterium]
MKIITGMHRSGTSLVARLFSQAGADMGSPETFYQADRWNPGGYYEQTDIHAVNMPLVNGIWWKFAYFFLPSTDTILRRAKKYEGLIRRIDADYRGKIVKENRFCLTLPAWQRYDTTVEKILICIRSPGQVVSSIIKRNHTTRRHGYYLWHLHNQRILRHAEKIPIWFIDYNNLLKPELFEKEMAAALNFFGIDFPADNIVNMGSKNVRRDMNHHAGRTYSYPPNVHELWRNLKQLHRNQFTGK